MDAVPVLESAEEADHRPSTAAALAGCQEALGELVLARDIYKSMASEKPSASWLPADKKAHDEAGKKAAALDVRIPTIALVLPDPAPPDLQVKVGDKVVTDLSAPIPVSPEEKVKLVATADGYDDQVETLLLHEGEKRHIAIALLKGGKPVKPAPKPTPEPSHNEWLLGGRFRGYLIPTFLMNLVADGGTTVYEPGFGFTATKMFGRLELTPSLQYTYYGMPDTPFKPHSAPDTEWEIDSSNLHSLAATVDVLYDFPLDAGEVVTFRIGGGVGIGWMFAGDLIRTQAYPTNLKPGDPYTYKKCTGPDNPAGTYRYCNALDKDKTRYNEPDKPWGAGGARPIIYPWLALPELGFGFKPTKRFTIDIEVAPSLSGFLTGVGARYAL